MAALTERARAARAESRRLRRATYAARLVTRRRVDATRMQLVVCWVEFVHVEALKARPLPGAWSELRWLSPSDRLDDVLVPLD